MFNLKWDIYSVFFRHTIPSRVSTVNIIIRCFIRLGLFTWSIRITIQRSLLINRNSVKLFFSSVQRGFKISNLAFLLRKYKLIFFIACFWSSLENKALSTSFAFINFRFLFLSSRLLLFSLLYCYFGKAWWNCKWLTGISFIYYSFLKTHTFLMDRLFFL